jgi:hypothetical protein
MLRCAASFITAAYAQVRLAPHDLRALPAELFFEAVVLGSLFDFLRDRQKWGGLYDDSMAKSMTGERR